jgi:hypothetical protein
MPKTTNSATAILDPSAGTYADASVPSVPGGPGAAAGTKRRAPRSRSARSASRAVAPVALGSLTQPGARQGACCQACASPRVTSLTLTLTDGTPVEFTSCHACEHRTWFSPTGELDRASVLERTRKLR